MEVWDSLDWLGNARKLIDWIRNRPQDNKLMLVLRHSHREEIVDHSAQLSTELTELGKEVSYEMGKRLPTSRPSHLFFSFVSRCYQTAEEIAKGFSDAGGEVIDMDPLPILVTPEIADESVWENLQPDGRNITDFINNWADGNFGEKIEKFEDYKSRLLKDTLVRILNTTRKEIHIHVTHDLALIAIKRILFKRPVAFKDREPFLGGIALEVDKEGNVILYSAGKELISQSRIEINF